MSENSCCGPAHENGHEHKKKFDYILYGSTGIILTSLAVYAAGIPVPYVAHFAHTVLKLLGTMWWGIALGMTVVGLMSKVPREYFQVLLGRGDSFGGILRATLAGLLLDLCSHGILIIGAKLYERGASLAQVMAFLIASPWNSISLTIILVSLIGLKWTLVFVAGSTLVAIVTGMIYKILVERGVLPPNPNKVELPKDFSIRDDMNRRLKGFKITPALLRDIAVAGWAEGKMLLRWLLVGVIIAALLNTFIPADTFASWFGPTLFGLAMTLVVTTIIETCSEGSAPVAAEILNRAAAPGNAFAFLMAGVSTDYTEIMILREMTKSWKVALSLPLVTVPQVMLLGYIINLAR